VLIVTARKVRSVRAAFSLGAEWLFDRETQRIEARTDAATTFRPTVLMDRICEALAGQRGLSARELRSAVKGSNTAKAAALRILIAEGRVDARPDGATVRHYLADVGTDGHCAQAGAPTVPPRA
jgi:hypothetical protein